MFPWMLNPQQQQQSSSFQDMLMFMEWMERKKLKEVKKKGLEETLKKDKDGEWIFIPKHKPRQFSFLEAFGIATLLNVVFVLAYLGLRLVTGH